MNNVRTDALSAIVSTPVAAGALAPRAVLRSFSLARRALSAGSAQLLLWQERATQRHHLSMIDADGLRDVGLTRADLEPEIRKPFWRS